MNSIVESLPPLDIQGLVSALSSSIDEDVIYGLIMGTNNGESISLELDIGISFIPLVEDALNKYIGTHPIRDLFYNRLMSVTRNF